MKEAFEQFLEDYYNYIPKTEIEVMGKKVKIPVLYSDVSAIMAFFSISVGRAKELIGTKRIKPVRMWGDRCLLGITIFDYIDCPVGPYREIALSIPIVLDSKVTPPLIPLLFNIPFIKYGFYTTLLAMNTDLGREHSEKIFGYPTYHKNINIDITERDGYVIINSNNDGKEILEMKVKKMGKIKKKKNNYNTFFIRDNKIIVVKMKAVSLLSSSKKRSNATLSLGNHEISEIIRSLDIHLRSFETIYYHKAIEVLDNPIDLGYI